MKKAPYFVLLLLCCTAFPLAAQSKVKVTGTGNTTGHIANLTIDNKGRSPIEINEQTAFIPSDGQYQPYIVTIPKTTVPPGTTTIPLPGVCADVTRPPVPPGEGMPPVDDWIAIDPVTKPGPGEAPVDIVKQTVPRFTTKSIPGITVSKGYTPKPPPTIPGIGLTWPGTDIIVGGVLDPDTDPKSSAPVLIEALQNIENAFDSLRQAGEIGTPFSGDPPRERESVIQQTFWFYAAGISGKRYQKEDFNNRVIEQYERNVGISVSKIPESERNKLDEGVDAFWNTFTAVGVEAKVLQAAESTNITPTTTTVNKTEPNPNDPPVLIKDDEKEGPKCACDTMEIYFAVTIDKYIGNMISDYEENQTAIFENTIDVGLGEKITASAPNVEKGKEVTLTVTPVLNCDCSKKGGECPESPGKELLIYYGKEKKDPKFGLPKVPCKIDVTVTKTCGSDTCKEIECTATISIEIKKETKKEKDAREKKAKEDADKAKENEEKKK